MTIDWAAWAIIAVLALVAIAARKRQLQLRHRADFRRNFFRAADEVLDEPGLNPAVVDLLDVMAAHIGSRTALWRFFWHSVRGRVRAAYMDPAGPMQEIFGAVMALPPAARDKCFAAMMNFIIALTYNHLFLGTFVRRVAFFAIGRGRKGSNGGSDATAAVVSDLVGDACRHAA